MSMLPALPQKKIGRQHRSCCSRSVEVASNAQHRSCCRRSWQSKARPQMSPLPPPLEEGCPPQIRAKPAQWLRGATLMLTALGSEPSRSQAA